MKASAQGHTVVRGRGWNLHPGWCGSDLELHVQGPTGCSWRPRPASPLGWASFPGESSFSAFWEGRCPKGGSCFSDLSGPYAVICIIIPSRPCLPRPSLPSVMGLLSGGQASGEPAPAEVWPWLGDRGHQLLVREANGTGGGEGSAGEGPVGRGGAQGTGGQSLAWLFPAQPSQVPSGTAMKWSPCPGRGHSMPTTHSAELTEHKEAAAASGPGTRRASVSKLLPKVPRETTPEPSILLRQRMLPPATGTSRPGPCGHQEGGECDG